MYRTTGRQYQNTYISCDSLCGKYSTHKEITILIHHDEKQWYMQYIKILVGCISFNPNILKDSIVTYKRKQLKLSLKLTYIQLSPAEYGVAAAIDSSSKSVTDT
jgi:hypothetical protein